MSKKATSKPGGVQERKANSEHRVDTARSPHSSRQDSLSHSMVDLKDWVLSWLPLREFFYLDLRSLAVLRIGIAVMVLADWIVRFEDLTAHYSDEGVLPRGTVPSTIPFSLNMIDGSPFFQGCLFSLGCVFALVLLVGYRTRFVTFVSWLLLIGVQARNPALMQGGDMLLRMLLFWGMFLPLGACFSLDASRVRTETDDRKGNRVTSLATIAFLAQVCIVYWFAAAWKWHPDWRADGIAAYKALNVDHLTTYLGQWMLQFPEFLRLLTHATILLEAVGPALLFLPFAPGWTRLFTVLAFIGFHAGLGICLNLSNFPWVCAVMWLALLPTLFWDWLGDRLRTAQRKGLTIYHDDQRPRCVRAIALLRTFLVIPGARWLPLTESGETAVSNGGTNSWIIVDHEGKKHTHFEGAIVLVKLSPLFWPFAYLMNLRWGRDLGDALYRRLEARRPGKETSPQPEKAGSATSERTSLFPARGLLENTILLLALVYVIFWNLRDLHRETYGPYFPKQLNAVGESLALAQGWGLFAPRPGDYKGWFVVVGYADGRQPVDLYRAVVLNEERTVEVDDRGVPINTDKPSLVSAMYPNGHWRKYMMNMGDASYYPIQPFFCEYLCRQWNEQHPDRQVQRVAIWFMHERYIPETRTFEEPVATLIYPHTCGGWAPPWSPAGFWTPEDQMGQQIPFSPAHPPTPQNQNFWGQPYWAPKNPMNPFLHKNTAVAPVPKAKAPR